MRVSRPKTLSTVLLIAGLMAISAVSATAASAATYRIHWHRAVHKVYGGGGFTGVSCANTTACYAVDTAGYLIWSKHPTRPPWNRTKIDAKGGGLTGIACPKWKFCVAVDANGNYLYSTNPRGGSRRWSRPARIDSTKAASGGYVGLSGVACAGTTLCVAVDNAADGQVFVSTNPTGGAGAWSRATIAPHQQLTGVSCPRTRLCVVSGTEHYYSTRVQASSVSWHAAGPAPGKGVLSAIGCAAGRKMCVAVGYNNTSSGFALATHNAAGGTWTRHDVETYPSGSTAGLLDDVACPNIDFCVAIDGADNAYTTNSPVHGHWSPAIPARRRATSNSAVISCVFRLCLAADNTGWLMPGTIGG